MSAVRQMHEKMSLRRSLRHAGISRRMWYHKPKARNVGLDLATVQVVQGISGKTPPMTRAAWQSKCAARRILPQIARRYREYSEDWAGLSLKRQKTISFAPIAISSSRTHRTSYGRLT